MASFSLHPRFSLLLTVSFFNPMDLFHSVTVLVSPFNVIQRVRRLFSACVFRYAQRQFSGEYNPFTLILSKLWFGPGWPISNKKFSNFFQRSHMVIPRPPYRCHPTFLLLVHRSIMWHHDLYARVLQAPCVVFNFVVTMLRKQPHDFVPPDNTRCRLVTITFPQSHRHSTCRPLPLLGIALKTTSLKKRFPVISMWADISLGALVRETK